MGLFRSTTITSRSNKIDAFQSTVCEFGTPVPLLYGTSKVSPNLMCYQDFTTKEKKTTQKSGKAKSVSITYLYSVYAELALGEGPIQGVSRIWVGDDEYSSLFALNNTSNEGNGLSLNKGDDSSPTTYMSTKHPDIATGYPALAYLYGYIFLGEDSASMPSYSVEVKGIKLDGGDGTDANPAYVIKDILTRIGLGTYIDEDSFENYAEYCEAADLLISTYSDAFNSQKKAQEIVSELLDLTNTYMYWSVDRFKFVPRDDVQRGGWTPNKEVQYDLTTADFIASGGAAVSFKRKDSTEIYNYITVNFLNRANGYEEESVSYQDTDSVKTYGVRSVSYDAKWFHTKERALKYAEMKARIAQNECNQYTFTLPWKYCRLEAGDLLRLTDEAVGLSGKVVMVSEVTEAKDGTLTVTAVSRADGDYSEPKYSVTDDYQYQDFNVEPGDTAAPLFIIPPSDLVTSASGLEVWIALHGSGKDWGGCDVYGSDKDGDYSLLGTQGVSSMYGATTSALTADGDSVSIRLSNPREVEMLTGSATDAENGSTLIWIDGECMSYTLATLTAANTYTLTGLIRGQYGTSASAHASGSSMAVLDGGIYVVPLEKRYEGRTLYFKFPAFNAFKSNAQALEDLDCYTVTASASDLPNVQGVTAYNKYRELEGRVVSHDIIVEWTPPAFDNYQQAQVWYKAGASDTWHYGSSGYKSATLPQVDIGTTYTIAVCTQDIYGNVETPDSSAQATILVALSTETPTTPSGVTISIGTAFNVSWNEVTNADVKYYEVRLDNQIGVANSNYLGKTTETSFSTNAVTSRTGTVYVFAVSAYGKTSAPAAVSYNFPTLSAPKVTVTAKPARRVECVVNTMPAQAAGIRWTLAGASYSYEETTADKRHSIFCEPDVYTVTACYYDYFGDGTASAGVTATVKATIDSSLIEAEAISADKLDAATQTALKNAEQTAKDLGTLSGNVYTKTETDDQISSAFVNFENGDLKSYATITQMNDAISLAVADIDIDGNEIISKINLADGTVTLDGKYIHVTGDTQFDKNIITSGMLQAGAVTADKMSVSSLSAISANLGTVTAGTLNAVTLNAANIKSGTISADVIEAAGYKVKSCDKVSGTITKSYSGLKSVNCGSIAIPLPDGFTTADCFVFLEIESAKITSTGEEIEDLTGLTQKLDPIDKSTYFEVAVWSTLSTYYHMNCWGTSTTTTINLEGKTVVFKYRVIGIK